MSTDTDLQKQFFQKDQLRQLDELLTQIFREVELKEFCLFFGIEYEGLPNENVNQQLITQLFVELRGLNEQREINEAVIRASHDNWLNKIKQFDRPNLSTQSLTFRVVSHQDVNLQLTVEFLEHYVLPFLQALLQLQTIINNIRGRTDPPPILIKKIESNSPNTVDITGVLQAVQVLRDLIVPWRRAHAHQSAELTLKQQEAQIADLEAQTKSKQTEVRKQRAEAKKAEASATAAKLQAEADAAKAQAEAQRIQAEAERLHAEATKLHAEANLLQFQEDKGRFELAVQIVDRYGSQLPNQQKLAHIAQLAGPLRILTTSPLEPIIPETVD